MCMYKEKAHAFHKIDKEKYKFYTNNRNNIFSKF